MKKTKNFIKRLRKYRRGIKLYTLVDLYRPTNLD